jgi:NTP pyrophosphatase (non-canonical NTP hydrolase)
MSRDENSETMPPQAKSLGAMALEVRELNVEKGWRGRDNATPNTFGDLVALLHSEVSEMLEAFRSWKFRDVTGDGWHLDGLPKPEGVGSEMADVLIRLLDMADIYGFDLRFEYERKVAYNRTRPYRHGGRTL